MDILSFKHTCLRCGRSWTGVLEHPKSCAKCGNPNWNKPKIEPCHQKCLHCNFEWVSTIKNPKRCPNCQHYNWDTPLKQRAINPIVHCDYCGEIIQDDRSPTKISRAKNHFCNTICRGKYQRKPTPQVRCAYCDEIITRRLKPSGIKPHMFCNSSHARLFFSKRPKLIIYCSTCGKQIERRYISKSTIKEHNFCNRKCRHKYQINYAYRKPKQNIVCSFCGEIIKRRINPNTLRRNKIFFCSRDCVSKYMIKYPQPHKQWNKGLTKETSDIVRNISIKTGKALKGRPRPLEVIAKISGEKAGRWQGGISMLPYAFEFNGKLKEKIKERDNYTCQLCHRTKGDGAKLAVHHIDFDKMNCDPNNLITLCITCNSKVNINRDWWTVHFQTVIKSHKNKNNAIRKWQKEYNALYVNNNHPKTRAIKKPYKKRIQTVNSFTPVISME